MKTADIAVLGAWHVHTQEYVRVFQSIPGIRVKCLWDFDQARGCAMASQLGIPCAADLEEVMRDKGISGVQVTAQTSLHGQLMLQAAKANKHIFTEKVLTIDPAEGKLVHQAVKKSGICFAISFPHLCRPALLEAKRLVSSGEIGQVSYARVRNAHDGAVAGWLPDHFYDPASCGGGAMIDLGAHPMYTLLWLLGEPLRVQSLFTAMIGKPVEDNAVSLLEYADGAIGVSETSFVSSLSPYTLEVSGTKGAVLVREKQLSYASDATGGKWVQADALPAAPPSPLRQWADALLQEEPGLVDMGDFGIEPALRLTRLMARAYAK